MEALGRTFTFIGPTSPVMRVLGDKIGSNLVAQAADVRATEGRLNDIGPAVGLSLR